MTQLPSFNQLHRSLFWQTVLYTLFLLPTCFALGQLVSGSPIPQSTLLLRAWHDILPWPWLTDILRYGVIGGISWGYYQGGKQTLEFNKKNLMCWILTLLALTFTLPFDSQDLYGYINRGVQQAQYDLNPYATTVNQIEGWQQNPWLINHWAHNPSPYGFFFTWFTQWAVAFSFGQYLLAILWIKLANVLGLMATAWGVYFFSKQLGHTEEVAQKNTYWFAWNPLILLQCLANGHNDLWVGLGLLFSFGYLTATHAKTIPLFKNTLMGAVISWCYAILVKYTALLAGPFYLVWLATKQQWKAILIALGVSTIILASWASLYLWDWQTNTWVNIPWREVGENATISQHSFNSMLYRMVFYAAKLTGITPPGNELRGSINQVLLAGFGLFFIWRLIRLYQTKQLLEEVVLAFTVLLCVVSAKFHPWYLATVFPLALLLPTTHWLKRSLLLLTIFQLLAFTPLENVHILNYALLTIIPLLISLRSKKTNRLR